MREALSYPEEPWASSETSPVERAPDSSDREFLTEEEKRALIAEIQTGLEAWKLIGDDSTPPVERSDLEARIENGHYAERALLEAHEGYIRTITRSYYSPSLTYDDLLQHGKLGFLLAVRQYQPSEESKFHEYAGGLVRREIREAIAETSRAIRLPKKLFWLVPSLLRTEQEFKHANGYLPSDEELASILGHPANRVADIRAVVHDTQAILDAPLPLGDNGSSRTLLDTIGSPDDTSHEEAEVRAQAGEAQILPMLDRLSEAQRAVIVRRLGLEGYPVMSYAEIAEDLGKAISGIKTADQRARNSLRAIMDSDINTGEEEKMSSTDERLRPDTLSDDIDMDDDNGEESEARFPDRLTQDEIRIFRSKSDRSRFKKK